jgi:hypothetical protein
VDAPLGAGCTTLYGFTVGAGLILVSDPALTAMPTCEFPAHWTPEAAKLCALSRPCPRPAVKVVRLLALRLDSRTSVPCLEHGTPRWPVGQYAGEAESPARSPSSTAPTGGLP